MMFWREVKSVRKAKEQMRTLVKGGNGELMTGSDEVKR